MSTILVIDDDPYIRELVGAILGRDGHSIIEAANGREALEQLGVQRIDLCVVDVMMPQIDGVEFARKARRYHEELPLLMLTAKGQIADKLEGFAAGADDYLVKPFESSELLARTRALLRRYHKVAALTVQAGCVTLDKNSYTACVRAGDSAEAQRLELPLKEFELLFLLASLPGKTLSRRQLIDDVWGYDFEGNERTLDVHINRLRERFGEAAHGFRIVTVRGLGYRLESEA